MTICSQEERVLEALVSAEATEAEMAWAKAHVAVCRDCAELRELDEQLRRVEIPEPDIAELGRVRREVLGRLRNERGYETASKKTQWWRPRALLSAPLPRLAAASAGITAALAMGFLGGRASVPTALELSDRLSIAPQIEYAAARAEADIGPSGSPFEYSNVRLETVTGNQVRLSFDVATHLELVRAKDDPLVAEVVVQSLLSRESVNTKLNAIDTEVSLEPRVRDALIASMLKDENVAVRLKAIARLTASTPTGLDPVVEKALLEVLRRDDSVQMRLVAIDCLTVNSIDPELLRRAIAEGRPEPGIAVVARAEKYFRSL